MCIVVDEDFCARRRVHVDGGLVRHRAGGKEQRGGLSQQLGDALFEATRRRVTIQVIVTDVGGRDGRAHRGTGPRDGIAAEVDRHGRNVAPIVSGRKDVGGVHYAASASCALFHMAHHADARRLTPNARWTIEAASLRPSSKGAGELEGSAGAEVHRLLQVPQVLQGAYGFFTCTFGTVTFALSLRTLTFGTATVAVSLTMSTSGVLIVVVSVFTSTSGVCT